MSRTGFRSPASLAEATRVIAGLADQNRLAIMCCLVERDSSAEDLARRLRIPIEELSEDLAVLDDLGFTERRGYGSDSPYTCRSDHVRQILLMLDESFHRSVQ